MLFQSITLEPMFHSSIDLSDHHPKTDVEVHAKIHRRIRHWGPESGVWGSSPDPVWLGSSRLTNFL